MALGRRDVDELNIFPAGVSVEVWRGMNPTFPCSPWGAWWGLGFLGGLMAFLGVKPQVGPCPTLPAGLGSSCLGPTSLPATSPHRKSWIPGSQASISSHSSNTPPTKPPSSPHFLQMKMAPLSSPAFWGCSWLGGPGQTTLCGDLPLKPHSRTLPICPL